jgi:hypothetical protein
VDNALVLRGNEPILVPLFDFLLWWLSVSIPVLDLFCLLLRGMSLQRARYPRLSNERFFLGETKYLRTQCGDQYVPYQS